MVVVERAGALGWEVGRVDQEAVRRLVSDNRREVGELGGRFAGERHGESRRWLTTVDREPGALAETWDERLVRIFT